MNTERILYRTRQFWQSLGPAITPEELKQARALLAPSQKVLFDRMQRSEQAHSVRVLRSLLDQGEEDPDLLVAALLHDVGKSRFPLRLWERILTVLGKVFTPRYAQRWGAMRTGEEGVPRGWRRAFVVAVRHPDWGAELAGGAGASPLTVKLIRRHQEKLSVSGGRNLSLEERLLLKLQSVDDES